GPEARRSPVCGVVGLLLKDPGLEPELGALLTPMIVALSDRGPDSSGIALYSRSAASDHRRISLGSDEVVGWPAVCDEVAGRLAVAARPLPSRALLEV